LIIRTSSSKSNRKFSRQEHNKNYPFPVLNFPNSVTQLESYLANINATNKLIHHHTQGNKKEGKEIKTKIHGGERISKSEGIPRGFAVGVSYLSFIYRIL
jgi:hypothetical protein